MSLKWNTTILTYSNLNIDTLVKLLLTCALSTKDIEDIDRKTLFFEVALNYLSLALYFTTV